MNEKIENIERMQINTETLRYLFENYLSLKLDKGEWVSLAEKLYEYWNRTSDSMAEQLYYTMKAKISQILYDNKGIFDYGTKSNQTAVRYGYKIYQSLSANALGNYYRYQGNYLTAFQNFWEAYHLFLDSGKELPKEVYKTTGYMLSQNIAACLADSGEYEKAIEYYQKVLVQIPDDNRSIFEELLLFMVNINIATNYNKLEQYKQAKKYLNICHEVADSGQHSLSQYISYILVADFIVQYGTGDRKRADKTMSQIQSAPEYWEEATAMQNMISFLLKTKQYELFLFFYEPLYDLAVKEGFLNFQIELVDGMRKYYDGRGEKESCSRMYTKLGELYVKQSKEREQAMKAAVHSSLLILEQQTKQKGEELERLYFKYKSEYDELTDIPNRYKMSKCGNEIFLKAISEKIPVCVSIIDVDYFKQINDLYGHSQGDICLQQIAAELKKLVPITEEQLCARYGGDEFIVIISGKSNEEILLDMQTLSEEIQRLAIPNIGSPISDIVTISQGAVNKIPGEDDSLDTYLKYADQGLYKAKKKSRNTMVLNH